MSRGKDPDGTEFCEFKTSLAGEKVETWYNPAVAEIGYTAKPADSGDWYVFGGIRVGATVDVDPTSCHFGIYQKGYPNGIKCGATMEVANRAILGHRDDRGWRIFCLGTRRRLMDACFLADGDRLFAYWYGSFEAGDANVEFFSGTLGVELDPERPWHFLGEPVEINRFDPSVPWQRFGENNQNMRCEPTPPQSRTRTRTRTRTNPGTLNPGPCHRRWPLTLGVLAVPKQGSQRACFRPVFDFDRWAVGAYTEIHFVFGKPPYGTLCPGQQVRHPRAPGHHQSDGYRERQRHLPGHLPQHLR